MNTCDEDHQEIAFNGDICPLCKAHDKIMAQADTVDELQEKLDAEDSDQCQIQRHLKEMIWHQDQLAKILGRLL